MQIYTPNLVLIVTERCNLNCAHCLRGKCTNKVMSDNVIEAVLSQFKAIGVLTIGGGEPLLALDRIEKIFSYIIENNILVNRVNLTINGIIYDRKFLKLLDYIEEYINHNLITKKVMTTFGISLDKYHSAEIKRLNLLEEYLENIERYNESKYLSYFQKLNKKLFREGNAVNLDKNLTVPLVPMRPVITYTGNLNMSNRFCNIGPIIAVNVNGTVTECDASIINQEKLYNYGNVLNNSLEEIYLKKKSLILEPIKWQNVCRKEIKKYSLK